MGEGQENKRKISKLVCWGQKMKKMYKELLYKKEGNENVREKELLSRKEIGKRCN